MAPAGTFAANAYRLQDMVGNVWNWFGDYASGLPSDPNGATSAANRVIRNGYSSAGRNAVSGLPRATQLSSLTASMAERRGVDRGCWLQAAAMGRAKACGGGQKKQFGGDAPSG